MFIHAGFIISLFDLLDHFAGLVLGLLDRLFDLVICLADLLLRFTCSTFCSAFGLEVLVVNQASGCLFCLALDLLGLSAADSRNSPGDQGGSLEPAMSACGEILMSSTSRVLA